MTHPETFSDLTDNDLRQVAESIEQAASREWSWAAEFPPGSDRMAHLCLAQSLAISARQYRERISL